MANENNFNWPEFNGKSVDDILKHGGYDENQPRDSIGRWTKGISGGVIDLSENKVSNQDYNNKTNNSSVEGIMTKYGSYKYASDLLKKTVLEEKLDKYYDVDPTQKLIDEIPNVSKAITDASKSIPVTPGKKTHGNYEKLSDEYMRDRINRIDLEKKYSEAIGDTRYVKSGSEMAREILQTTGAIVGILGTGATAAYTIYKMSKSDK